MLDFSHLELRDEGPIYAQIIDFVKRELVSGRAQDGDVLPSRRVLSSLLGINPNTIQKSYKLLEEQGIIASQAGAKSLISIEEGALERIREEMIQSKLRESIRNLKHMGMDKEGALKLMEAYWEEEAHDEEKR